MLCPVRDINKNGRRNRRKDSTQEFFMNSFTNGVSISIFPGFNGIRLERTVIQTDCVCSSMTRHSNFSNGSRNTHVKRPLKCYDLIAYLKNHNTFHFCHDSDITYLRVACKLNYIQRCIILLNDWEHVHYYHHIL